MPRQKRRLYVGIMILGGAALITDQLIPAGQEAAPREAEASLLRPEPVSPPEASLSIPELPFPRGIKPLDGRSDLPDLFAPPSLQPISMSVTTDNQATKPPDGIGPMEVSHTAFSTRHTVEGVMIDQRLRIAVIDGELRQLGQTIDGCTLVEITDTEVRFECRDGSAALRVGEEEVFPEG